MKSKMLWFKINKTIVIKYFWDYYKPLIAVKTSTLGSIPATRLNSILEECNSISFASPVN